MPNTPTSIYSQLRISSFLKTTTIKLCSYGLESVVEELVMVEDEKKECQLIEEASSWEAETRRRGILSRLVLEEENARYADSGGISINNRDQGFLPAFQDLRSGCCQISRFADGRPAPIHMLDGLPEDWIEAREANGQALRTCPQIISGFIRNGCFYTRDEVSQAILTQGITLS